MESINPAAAQRVWQRVRRQDSAEGDLARLLTLSQMQAEDLKYLDQELYRREKINREFLRGLHHICDGGTMPAMGRMHPLPLAQRLRRCRERCREMLMLCVKLEQHPKYGALFTDLTRWQRAACAQLEQRK